MIAMEQEYVLADAASQDAAEAAAAKCANAEEAEAGLRTLV